MPGTVGQLISRDSLLHVETRRRTRRGRLVKATQLLANLGQSIWLDNITRDWLDTGTRRLS